MFVICSVKTYLRIIIMAIFIVSKVIVFVNSSSLSNSTSIHNVLVQSLIFSIEKPVFSFDLLLCVGSIRYAQPCTECWQFPPTTVYLHGCIRSMCFLINRTCNGITFPLGAYYYNIVVLRLLEQFVITPTKQSTNRLPQFVHTNCPSFNSFDNFNLAVQWTRSQSQTPAFEQKNVVYCRRTWTVFTPSGDMKHLVILYHSVRHHMCVCVRVCVFVCS